MLEFLFIVQIVTWHTFVGFHSNIIGSITMATTIFEIEISGQQLINQIWFSATEALDRFVVDKPEKPESPKLSCHTRGAVTPPSGLAQTLPAPGRPSRAQFCAPLVKCNLSRESPSSTRASPQRDPIQRVDGSPISHGHLNDNCDGLLEVDQGLEVDAINPSIMELEIQGRPYYLCHRRWIEGMFSPLSICLWAECLKKLCTDLDETCWTS